MRIPKIYTPQELCVGKPCSLDAVASQHLAKALRAKEGDAVRLFNGKGSFFDARVSALSKKSVEVEIESEIVASNESPLESHLAIVMSRGDRMDYAIQKSVELGVNSITPLTSERCEVKLNAERQDKRLAHWQQVAVSACEQSGRATVPVIEAIQTLESYVMNAASQEKPKELKLVLHHRAEQRLDEYETPESVRLLIGPEGGLSQEEISLAQQYGFAPCTLGKRVFRTETAPVASLAVMQWLWGDFNNATR